MSREIVLAISVPGRPSDVYRALTTRDGITAFWTSEADVDVRVGGELRLGFPGAPTDLRMLVGGLDEDRRVEWQCPASWPSWVGTTVEWSIADGDETTVVFSHRGWVDGLSDLELGSVALVWARVLMALAAYVESGKPAPALG